MNHQAVRKVKRNGSGFCLGVALMITNPEAREEEDRLTRNDHVLGRQRRSNARRQWPSFDPGVLGSLNPEKLLLLKEFLREKAGVQGDLIVYGDNCEGLANILTSPTDLMELRQILRA